MIKDAVEYAPGAGIPDFAQVVTARIVQTVKLLT